MTETNTKSVHQELMNKAYELWKKEENKKLKYSDFLDLILKELGEIYFHAVITGNLNYQVCNGGFNQWHDNGYSKVIDEIIDFFNMISNKHKTILTVLDILNEFNEELCWMEDGIQEAKKSLSYEYKQFFEEKLEENFFERIEKIDHMYYDINEELEKVLEDYFKTEYDKISTEIREENT